MRIAVTVIFAAAFVAGAVVAFGLTSFAGASLIAAALPEEWRMRAAAAALLALAIVDVLTLRRDRYSPLSWRRQTPQALMYRHPVPAVAAVWGFDTGLAITTFRVAATTWGALVLGLLGLSSWWSGIAYGLSFALPLSILLFVPLHAAQRLRSGRRWMQTASAIALVAGSAVLFTSGGFIR